MGLSLSGSKYITVYNLTIRPSFSTKVVFADLVVSRKTGKLKMNPDTNDVITNENGEPVYERVFQRFKAKFVGEGAKKIIDNGFVDGTVIDIIDGWLEQESFVDKNDNSGKKKTVIYCIISDYEISSSNQKQS